MKVHVPIKNIFHCLHPFRSKISCQNQNLTCVMWFNWLWVCGWNPKFFPFTMEAQMQYFSMEYGAQLTDVFQYFSKWNSLFFSKCWFEYSSGVIKGCNYWEFCLISTAVALPTNCTFAPCQVIIHYYTVRKKEKFSYAFMDGSTLAWSAVLMHWFPILLCLPCSLNGMWVRSCMQYFLKADWRNSFLYVCISFTQSMNTFSSTNLCLF